MSRRTPARIFLAAAAVWALFGAAPAPASPPPGAPPVEFRAPFISADFLRGLAAEIARLRAESERLQSVFAPRTTSLLWARRDNAANTDWYAARRHCRDLELGGWIDWRLPTIDELDGLHDRRSNAIYKLPAAIRLTACCPWSSTLHGDDSAWHFNFRFRKSFTSSRNLSFELRALCVRTASAPELEELEALRERAEERRQSKTP